MSPSASDSRVELVLLAQPRGFCAGVEMAIKALAWMVRTFPAPVYCYHEIVHNKLVVDRFVDQGVVFVDDIADVPVGSPIMLSAHGSAPEVVEAARSRGSYVVDSVCPLVTKVHHEVKVRAGKGYRIVYVGHDGHEEAIGTMAVAPDSIDRVESVEEVDRLEPSEQPVALLAQTTLSHRDWEGVAVRVKERFPDVWTPGRSDLCFATTNRQAALMELAHRCDVVIVIGSANSSNTRALEQLAREEGCERVYRINSVDELPSDLVRHRRGHRRRVGAGGTRRSGPRLPRTRRRASNSSTSPRRTSTSLPRATSANCRHRSRPPRRHCSAEACSTARAWTTAASGPATSSPA